MFGNSTRFLRDIWALARPYWFSEERWAARGLLLVIVVLNLGTVFIDVLLNDWNRQFFNALQERNGAAFLPLMLHFTVLAGIWIGVAVYRVYLRQLLQIRWRRWLTDRYVEHWLAGRTYYRMQLVDTGTDNPDQRIAEDVRDFVENTLVLSLGLMNAIVSFISFATILWALSGTLRFTVAGVEIALPGYMLWAALAYAVVGSWLTHRIGRPLIPLIFGQQRFEADFRFSLVRFRENAEGVALYAGETRERATLGRRFAGVVENWWGIMRRQKQVGFFTNMYGQVAVVFPFLMAGPRYFAGQIELGELTQTAGAFGHVQTSLSWFIDAYASSSTESSITRWKATVDRLITFTHAMDRVAPAATAAPSLLVLDEPGRRDVDVRSLDLALPDGRALLSRADLTLHAGESVLLSGPSGSGKSTLFRAIAGIWPYGSGTIARPAGMRRLFLPQKPYLPIDTLRAVLTYPEAPPDIDDAALAAVLAACDLPHLVARLDDQEHWAQALSPGEQQRIAFARAFLYKPDWLFLDEASAALDEVTETRLYQALPEHLPGTTVVSIGHRTSLRAFHARHIEIRRTDGRWGLADLPRGATISAQ